MPPDNLVKQVSDLPTALTCDGCGNPLSALENHLLMSSRVERATIETQDLRFAGAPTDEDGQIIELAKLSDEDAASPVRYYLGFQRGESTMLTLHDYDCLKLWTDAQAKAEAPLDLVAHAIDEHAEMRSSE